MVTLEQVKLLDLRVTKAVEYIKKINDENSALKGKLDTYQRRIDDLEVLIRKFKEDQSRIEDGILSALGRLNQFEDALENKFSIENKIPIENKFPAAAIPETKPENKISDDVQQARKKPAPEKIQNPIPVKAKPAEKPAQEIKNSGDSAPDELSLIPENELDIF